MKMKNYSELNRKGTPKVRTLCPICGGTLSQIYRATSKYTLVINCCLNKGCNYQSVSLVPTTVIAREQPEILHIIAKRGVCVVITQITNYRLEGE